MVHQPNLEGFFDRVPYEEVIPTAGSRAEAIATAERILGLKSNSPDQVLGFRVTLENEHHTALG